MPNILFDTIKAFIADYFATTLPGIGGTASAAPQGRLFVGYELEFRGFLAQMAGANIA